MFGRKGRATGLFASFALVLISGGFVPPQQGVVELIDGNAAEHGVFDIIAYANIDHQSPPPEISIVDNCGADCWRYNGWIALKQGHYIEATFQIPTTGIGVQLWGDQDDGWGRVLVDGQQVWEGDTFGAEPTLFIKYLSVTGLASETHTIRVEHVSGGPVTIWLFGTLLSGSSEDENLPEDDAPPEAEMGVEVEGMSEAEGAVGDLSENDIEPNQNSQDEVGEPEVSLEGRNPLRPWFRACSSLLINVFFGFFAITRRRKTRKDE